MKPLINFEQFAAMDLRIGEIVACVEKEGSEKLLRLTVHFGEDGKRNILTGIKQWYKAEELVGKRCLFIINLEPRRMMGEESEGMFLAAEGSDRPIPLVPAEDVPPGTSLR